MIGFQVRNPRAIGLWGSIPVLTLPILAAAQTSPYPPSTVITGISLDWSTHERGAVGSDNFQLTWSDDNHQYGAWGDGGGFGATGSGGADRVSLGVAGIEGPHDSWTGHNVWGGKDHEDPAEFPGKSWGMISVNSDLYMWVTVDHPNHYAYVEVARSTNHGATWSKANWRFEQSEWLTIPTFLNFGRDNAGARDNYVYSYFIRPEDTTQGDDKWLSKPGVIYLARVDQNKVRGPKAEYQFLTGFDDGSPTGNPIWGSIADKTPVFEDPEGAGAVISVSYNPGIGRYILATQHTESSSSVLGIFDAPEPWGPWTTVKYYTPSDRFGETRPGSALDWEHNVFFLAFPTKWLSADGETFTMVFTGAGKGKNNDSFSTVRGAFALSDSGHRDPQEPNGRVEETRLPAPSSAHPRVAAAEARFVPDERDGDDDGVQLKVAPGMGTMTHRRVRYGAPHRFLNPGCLSFPKTHVTRDHWLSPPPRWTIGLPGRGGGESQLLSRRSPLPGGLRRTIAARARLLQRTWKWRRRLSSRTPAISMNKFDASGSPSPLVRDLHPRNSRHSHEPAKSTSRTVDRIS